MITAEARPWAHGWQLHVEGYGVTQVRDLVDARQQVRDYVATMTGTEVTDDVRVYYDTHVGVEDVEGRRSVLRRRASLRKFIEDVVVRDAEALKRLGS